MVEGPQRNPNEGAVRVGVVAVPKQGDTIAVRTNGTQQKEHIIKVRDGKRRVAPGKPVAVRDRIKAEGTKKDSTSLPQDTNSPATYSNKGGQEERQPAEKDDAEETVIVDNQQRSDPPLTPEASGGGARDGGDKGKAPPRPEEDPEDSFDETRGTFLELSSLYDLFPEDLDTAVHDAIDNAREGGLPVLSSHYGVISDLEDSAEITIDALAEMQPNRIYARTEEKLEEILSVAFENESDVQAHMAHERDHTKAIKNIGADVLYMVQFTKVYDEGTDKDIVYLQPYTLTITETPITKLAFASTIAYPAQLTEVDINDLQAMGYESVAEVAQRIREYNSTHQDQLFIPQSAPEQESGASTGQIKQKDDMVQVVHASCGGAGCEFCFGGYLWRNAVDVPKGAVLWTGSTKTRKQKKPGNGAKVTDGPEVSDQATGYHYSPELGTGAGKIDHAQASPFLKGTRSTSEHSRDIEVRRVDPQTLVRKEVLSPIEKARRELAVKQEAEALEREQLKAAEWPERQQLLRRVANVFPALAAEKEISEAAQRAMKQASDQSPGLARRASPVGKEERSLSKRKTRVLRRGKKLEERQRVEAHIDGLIQQAQEAGKSLAVPPVRQLAELLDSNVFMVRRILHDRGLEVPGQEKPQKSKVERILIQLRKELQTGRLIVLPWENALAKRLDVHHSAVARAAEDIGLVLPGRTEVAAENPFSDVDRIMTDLNWLPTLAQEGMTLGRAMEMWRLAAHMSAQEFADTAGVPLSGLKAIEVDGTNPTVGRLIQLLAVSKIGEGSKAWQLAQFMRSKQDRKESNRMDPKLIDEFISSDYEDLIRYMRIASGKTQEEVGKVLGYNATAIAYFEAHSDVMRMSPQTLAAYIEQMHFSDDMAELYFTILNTRAQGQRVVLSDEEREKLMRGPLLMKDQIDEVVESVPALSFEDQSLRRKMKSIGSTQGIMSMLIGELKEGELAQLASKAQVSLRTLYNIRSGTTKIVNSSVATQFLEALKGYDFHHPIIQYVVQLAREERMQSVLVRQSPQIETPSETVLYQEVVKDQESAMYVPPDIQRLGILVRDLREATHRMQSKRKVEFTPQEVIASSLGIDNVDVYNLFEAGMHYLDPNQVYHVLKEYYYEDDPRMVEISQIRQRQNWLRMLSQEGMTLGRGLEYMWLDSGMSVKEYMRGTSIQSSHFSTYINNITKPDPSTVNLFFKRSGIHPRSTEGQYIYLLRENMQPVWFDDFVGKSRAEKIHYARVCMGLFQWELGDELGVTQKAISLIEAGEKGLGNKTKTGITSWLDTQEGSPLWKVLMHEGPANELELTEEEKAQVLNGPLVFREHIPQIQEDRVWLPPDQKELYGQVKAINTISEVLRTVRSAKRISTRKVNEKIGKRLRQIEHEVSRQSDLEGQKHEFINISRIESGRFNFNKLTAIRLLFALGDEEFPFDITHPITQHLLRSS